MAEQKNHPYRVQDQNGIIQVESLKDGLRLIMEDPEQLGFIVENSSGKVVTVWMMDDVGLGNVWLWRTTPEFKHEVDFYLREIEDDQVDETGLNKKQREEVEKMLTGRGAEKIYERFVEEVDDYVRDNVSFPFEAVDEQETAERILEYAWIVFKHEFLSDRHSSTKEGQ